MMRKKGEREKENVKDLCNVFAKNNITENIIEIYT